jgi:hypothetical protein
VSGFSRRTQPVSTRRHFLALASPKKPSARQEETLSANYEAVSSLFTLCSAFEAALYPFSQIVVTADEQLFTSKRARLPLRAEEIVLWSVCQRLELEHQFMALRE